VGKLHYSPVFQGGGKTPYEFKEFVKQCYVIGYNPPLVTITGFIMGLVLITIKTNISQSWEQKPGCQVWLHCLNKEIVLLLPPGFAAGKVSSGIGAELGFYESY
jgi:phospholipid/cholesterol/gamma-HCH transport system permease protein